MSPNVTSSLPGRTRSLGFLVAVASIAALTGLKIALLPLLPHVTIRVLDVLTIGLVAYLYGLWPGLLALALSVFGQFYVYMPPMLSLGVSGTTGSGWFEFGMLVFGDVVAVVAMDRLRESRRRLSTEVEDRARAEEALRESEAQLRTVLENMTEGAVVSTLEGRLIHWNRAALQMHGYSSLDEAQKLLPELEQTLELFEMDGTPIPLKNWPMARVLRGEMLRNWDVRINRRDQGWQKIFSYGGSVIRDDEGTPLLVLVTIADITERKHAEEALRESEQQFRTLASTMPQLAWMADADGYIFWYNERWYEYTGTTPKQMEGWGWQSVHDPEMLPKVMERWKGSIATGEPFDMEFPLKGSDGKFRWFLTRVIPLKDREGHVTRWFGTNTDITEQLEAQKQLRTLTEELEQRVDERTAKLQASNTELDAAYKEMQSLSYSIMHDLRTPLRAIGGFSDALLKHYSADIDDKGRDYLQRISGAAQKMSQIIDDIHDLLRATRAEVRREDVDMSAMALEILGALQDSQPERKAEISAAPGMVVSADPSLLRAALGHLLGNAWKFTSKGEIARIEVAAIKQNGKRVYLVRDNGVGFNPAYADKLFKPFQRLHTGPDFSGTGMGLALVQRILRRHGGEIWAESEVGKGATFYFTFGEAENERLQDSASGGQPG